MRYRSTRQLVEDLRAAGRLVEITQPIDPHLQLAEIHRRVFASAGPAVLYSNVIGCRFPVVSNLWGTLERARWIYRDTFESLQRAIRWKVHPEEMLAKPWQLWQAPQLALRMLPQRTRRGAVRQQQCRLSELPQITCWPDDGGAFVTLPQVMSQSPGSHRLSDINLGMYRIQMSGNEYQADQECGLHYQLHRGIGVHHTRAIELSMPFPVNVTVGGTPAMTLAAVMPLPEGMSELGFAGALAGGRIRLNCQPHAAPLYADADFAIVGSVEPSVLKPEGPFGDHLGYYARQHDFPVLKVKHVYHRRDAVWPLTVVGRPPQEDTIFGELIHELTEPVIPTVLPGIRAVHAVDAAGVHPLLLAIGSERYTPYARPGRPQELLTQASALLGQGQLSLAKYLWITDAQELDIQDVQAFFTYMLQRVDWRSDLHFHTRTTIDTLDYSGDSLHSGSKLVVAAVGPPRRGLDAEWDSNIALPSNWTRPRMAMPGVVCVEASAVLGRDQSGSQEQENQAWQQACDRVPSGHPMCRNPLYVIVDDSEFATRSLGNFIWTTFTRSNPAADVYGVGAEMIDKHFSVHGSLVIDARRKPHHAPPLIEDSTVSAQVDALATQQLPISRYL